MIAPQHAERTPSVLPPGAVVAGRYEIEDVLGGGGMAVVYRARHVVEPDALAPDVLEVRYDQECADLDHRVWFWFRRQVRSLPVR